MGRNKSWFSSIRRLFKPCYTGQPVNGLERKNTVEKKKVGGKLRNGDTRSFIPLFRKPSSIEEILGEADQQNIIFRPPISVEKSETASPRRLSSAKAASPRATSPRVTSLRVTSPKGSSRRATSPRVASPQVTSPRGSSRRPTSPRVASPQVTSPRGSSRRPTFPRVASSQVTFPQVTSQQATSPRSASPQVTSPRDVSQKVTSSQAAPLQVTSPREVTPTDVVRPLEVRYSSEPITRNHHLSAIKIQAVYRGYLARKNFKAFKGLLRLLEVVKGQNVTRQTKNAMKMMRTLVQVQTQIQSLRKEMIKNHAIHRQVYKNEKALESTLSKWNPNQSEEDWDHSFLTKEERDARLQKKMEAMAKRERTVAYAYSHKMWRSNPNQSQTSETQSNEFPWLWNWLDTHLLPENHPESQTVKNFHATPPRRTPEPKRSPRPSPKSFKQFNSGFNTPETGTPTSTRSAMPARSKYFYTPPNLTPARSSSQLKQSRNRRSSLPFDAADTESLTSCPAFSGPRYMSPTAAARAKMRDPKERLSVSPTPRKRFSFPLTPDNGSSKWNRGRDSCGASTVSMSSSTVGKKPFNRFV